MNLLLFSDLHCDLAAAQAIVDRADDFDALLGAGDFGRCRRGVSQTIDVLKAIGRPTVLVPGNAESVEELTEACAKWAAAHVLHGTGTSISGVAFFGIGGGIPVTPFGDWSYDFSEEEATDLLAECPRECVLVSHSPPQGAVDIDATGRCIGSTALRNAVEERSPRLVACGHIHACWQQTAMIGSTPIVNAGPRGVAWKL